jgi:glutaredoxin 2
MKNLNERKLIQEEIIRISELIGKKQIIKEQSQFLKKTIDDAVDIFKDYVGKASKLRDENVWLIGGQRVSEDLLQNFEQLIQNPQLWSNLEPLEKKLIGTIMRSDTTYVNKIFDDFVTSLESELSMTKDEFLLKLFKTKEQTGKTTQEILDEMWGDPYVASLLGRKIDTEIGSLPEMVTRAKKPNYWVELFNDYEPQFMKFLRQSFVDGYFKKSQTIIKEIEKELDTISYKLVGENGVRGKISENVETIINKLGAMKFSTRQEVESAFKKYLIDNKIIKSSAEGDAIISSPRIKTLLEDKALGIQKSLMLPLKSKLNAWGEILNFLNIFTYVKAWKGNSSQIESAAKRLGNVIFWKDPQNWEEIQRSYYRSGVAGKLIDKTIGLVLINFGIIPALLGWWDSYLQNEDIKENTKLYQGLKTLCDDDSLPPEMCAQLNNMKADYLTVENVRENMWKNMPIGMDKGWWNLMAGTYVDDIAKFTIKLLDSIGTGGETTEEDIKGSFSELISKNREALEKAGWDFNKSQKDNMERIRQIAGERENNKKSIGATPSGFKAWADVNGYTVTNPYNTETGIGKAYKNDDTTKTPVEFEFKDGTFKP